MRPPTDLRQAEQPGDDTGMDCLCLGEKLVTGAERGLPPMTKAQRQPQRRPRCAAASSAC